MTTAGLLADKAFNAGELVIEPLLARGKSSRDPAQEQCSVRRDFDNEDYKAATSRISSANSRRHRNRKR
jgi:hypothetical protein